MCEQTYVNFLSLHVSKAKIECKRPIRFCFCIIRRVPHVCSYKKILVHFMFLCTSMICFLSSGDFRKKPSINNAASLTWLLNPFLKVNLYRIYITPASGSSQISFPYSIFGNHVVGQELFMRYYTLYTVLSNTPSKSCYYATKLSPTFCLFLL